MTAGAINPDHYYGNIIGMAAALPVGEVCPVQTSAIQDKAPLAVSHAIMDLLLGRVVWHTAAGSVPRIGAVGQ